MERGGVEEKEGRETKRVKAKRARASSDKQAFFISWMERGVDLVSNGRED